MQSCFENVLSSRAFRTEREGPLRRPTRQAHIYRPTGGSVGSLKVLKFKVNGGVPSTFCLSRCRRLSTPRCALNETQSAEADKSGVFDQEYIVSQLDKEAFQRDGYVHLRGVLSEEELATIIEPVYTKFMTGELKPEGRDLCDMSGATNLSPEDFKLFNAMLPRKYYPSWQGNVFELRCQSIADQLCQGDMMIDYDQILAKRPLSEDATFAWHQDMAYWPPFTKEHATATCWLALDDSTVQNGCMRFLPGSHKEPELRRHSPVKLASSRMDDESSHALCTEVDEEKEKPLYVEISRGDITVHNENVVHGSGPNRSEGWRRAYVLAFRKRSTVEEERKHGFTHSHNDTFNWDQYHDWVNDQ
ncbi:hypothetical protein CYMTET_14491 [Cymbomonas tetramitiformis]|uniref:Phytanoyl-CoA dioxygenase n=1 Tax=Cymbomonas tetramitiformis TaxID=36881 RepID=A0AAE0LAB2_9CHLO|nr:hypothetical protein CYMTET_14491 [Cymbomonas tetramitiformis]